MILKKIKSTDTDSTENGREKKEIYYIVDTFGWVQENRYHYLIRYLGAKYSIHVLDRGKFIKMWKSGLLRNQFIYFASWRIPFALSHKEHCRFERPDFQKFMTSVTSHYNIGGGLCPEKALPKGMTEGTAYKNCIEFLKQFKIITANSKILFTLLKKDLPQIQYAPNGVDTELFKPLNQSGKKRTTNEEIKVGWVGKKKAAKNYDLLGLLKKRTKDLGIELAEICINKKQTPLKHICQKIFKKPAAVSFHEMPKFYNTLDYYLCTSWHEGTPNPALEAASCGVPVISTRVGNMPELLKNGENGFLTDPDEKALIDLLKHIKNKIDGECYSRMSVKIRHDILENWTWERQMKNYDKIFEKFVNDNN